MNTQDNIRQQSHKDPAQLEREIDQQRDHIGEIVQALESRLAPGDMLRRFLGAGKDGSGEFAHNLGATIKANPVPTLMTAAGLLWLAAGQNRHATHASPTSGTTAGTHASHAHAIGEHMHQMHEGMSEKLGTARQRAGESMHHAMDGARHGAQRANEGFHRMLDENPMAIGAMGIAVGALLGALLPSTRKEDELMGQASDRLKDEARHLAREGRDQVAAAGRDVTEGHGDSAAGTSAGAPQPSRGSSNGGSGASPGGSLPG